MKSSTATPWFCAQIGAREHYAVPRALDRTGQLSLLVTDFWAGPALRSMANIVPARGLRALASRFHPDLSGRGESKIYSWNFKALSWEMRLRRRSHDKDSSDLFLGFAEVGREFATAVREQLKRRRDWSPDAIYFGYDTGALETLEWLREQGNRSTVDQMDPNRAEVEIMREEEKRWPGWATCRTEVPETYLRRREQEWALADRVVVNSEFCRQALLQQGVPEAKLSVIPLCYEAPVSDSDRSFSNESTRALNVLWLGQVILRKGIPYFLEAARLLAEENIHFDVVGPIGISDEAINSAPANVTFHGLVSRDEAILWYRKADVFVLPTLSDGFGLSQLEAMAHGLPVIATPNCGKVVTDGVDGFIVPTRNAEDLAHAIHRYRTEPNLCRDHQVAAQKKAGDFTIDHLARQLGQLEAELRG